MTISYKGIETYSFVKTLRKESYEVKPLPPRIRGSQIVELVEWISIEEVINRVTKSNMQKMHELFSQDVYGLD
jgi:predicted CoA-binding protein